MSRSVFFPVATTTALAWLGVALLGGSAFAVVIYQNYDGITPGVGSEFVYRQTIPSPPPSQLGSRAALGFTTDGGAYSLEF